MPRIKHYTQLIILDTLAVLLMIAALLTGWLPGPGGIPLFLLGLSLLAINHDWARKYLDLLREHADRLGDLIFIPKLRLFFDIIAPLFIAAGILLIIYRESWYLLYFGIIANVLGLIMFLGNRNRWHRIKAKLFNKH